MDVSTLDLAPIIMDLSRMIHQINTRELQPARLGSGQKRLLKLVIEEPGLRQSRIARALNLHRSTVCHTIKSLEERNYVRRAQHPTDPPGRRIYATKLGHLMFGYSHHALDFLEMQLADGFTREELARFAEYLFRARRHLMRPPWDSLSPLERMEQLAMVAMSMGKYDTFQRRPAPLKAADPNKGFP